VRGIYVYTYTKLELKYQFYPFSHTYIQKSQASSYMYYIKYNKRASHDVMMINRIYMVHAVGISYIIMYYYCILVYMDIVYFNF